MALSDPLVEVRKDRVGTVDLVACGGEVLADGAEVSATVDGVFQQPGGLRLVRVGARAGVLAQLGLQVWVDSSGVDEVDQAVGEVWCLRPGGQPDGQPPGGDVVDNGAAAVSLGDAILDEALVQRQVWQRPGLGQPIGGSFRRSQAIIGLRGIHLTGVESGCGAASGWSSLPAVDGRVPGVVPRR
jgi:hypothetical protein